MMSFMYHYLMGPIALFQRLVKDERGLGSCTVEPFSLYQKALMNVVSL